MNKQKKRKELHHLGILRSFLLSDFPDGREDTTEKPDFIIDDGTRKTGIEVTSIFHDSPPSGNPIQAQWSERQSLLGEALRLYNSKGHPAVHVSFHFAASSKFNKANRIEYAKTIAEVVASHLPTIGETIRIENEFQPKTTIPVEIQTMFIHRLNGTQSTFFNMPVAGWVQEDCSPTIQSLLNRKEQSLPEYQKCTKHWLLIVAEWSAPTTFFNPSDQALAHKYTSSFDRVFFLNMFGRKLVELKVEGDAG